MRWCNISLAILCAIYLYQILLFKTDITKEKFQRFVQCSLCLPVFNFVKLQSLQCYNNCSILNCRVSYKTSRCSNTYEQECTRAKRAWTITCPKNSCNETCVVSSYTGCDISTRRNKLKFKERDQGIAFLRASLRKTS